MTSYFCIPVPYNEKDLFLGILVLEGLVVLHRIIQLYGLLPGPWLILKISFLHLPYWKTYESFPSDSNGKEFACNAGDPVPSLGKEDSLEKRITIHSSILAWEIPWTEEPGRLSVSVHDSENISISRICGIFIKTDHVLGHKEN